MDSKDHKESIYMQENFCPRVNTETDDNIIQPYNTSKIVTNFPIWHQWKYNKYMYTNNDANKEGYNNIQTYH